MIANILLWIILFPTLIFSVWFIVYVLKNPIKPQEASWLTKDELGDVEERISNLKEVILIANQIEVPSKQNAKEILAALLDNFAQGVIYIFLVPEPYEKEYGDAIRKKYFSIIAMAKEVIDSDINKDLFKIKTRPQYPEDYPFLFYRFLNKKNESEIVAYRGEDKGKGIAENYRRLEPEVARSFLFQVLPFINEDFKKEIKEYERFTEKDKILAFDQENSKARELAFN